MEKLKLNDFDSFDAFLFGGKTPDWRRFYDKEMDTFFPPIDYPTHIAEYQLNHYTMWMVVSTFALWDKPYHFNGGHIPVARCYACDYKRRYGYQGSCECRCPLVLGGYVSGCGKPYTTYVDLTAQRDPCDPLSVSLVEQAAEQVARMKWRELGVFIG